MAQPVGYSSIYATGIFDKQGKSAVEFVRAHSIQNQGPWVKRDEALDLVTCESIRTVERSSKIGRPLRWNLCKDAV